jgi:lipopolysaccharide transport system permease protein
MAESAETAAKRTPTLVIEPRHGWRSLGLSELWEYRELLFFLVWRDLKVRYKQTFFGASWAILQPVLLMVIFSISVGRLEGVSPPGVPYPLFVLSGLVPWMLFAQSLAGASNSLVAEEAIITKVYFPRLLLPFAAVSSFLLDFVLALSVLGVMMLLSGVTPGVTVLAIIPLTLLVLVAALGVGTLLAAVNVRYRDVRYAVPFLIQVWLFASPVIYSSDLIPEQWRTLYALNPMTGAIEGFRWALLGGDRPSTLIFVSAAVSVAVLLGALLYFRRTERTFVDII